MKKYKQLVERLKKEGYMIEEKKDKEYIFWDLKGNCIRGGFATETEESIKLRPQLNGKIAIDHKHCFDKWGKCPLILSIPSSEKQMEFLVEKLKFFGTDEGYKISNEYDIDKWVFKYDD